MPAPFHLDSPSDLLPALTPLLPDPTPLWWLGGGVAAAFTAYVLLLLPFALCGGEVGRNARAILRQLFALFHALIDVFRTRSGGGR
ncbi:hypothetical protein [Paractinoplanes atraurantiacus]|uniref:Uncharacterized protein n=1 Tax=Paractinoplanes atraurantiacus TaxID=1036182 RepID=A0A285IWS8_9ACTN|nr:hypothetical protein [Actinoplanes atraurantiacus]SNY52495.1 hypothetical protein SAMN05421748_11316 [Actinoplanes atraurantiacus]